MNNGIDIIVILKVCIKPSTPTPYHLCHYQLSYSDQIAPSSFMPMVLFYPSIKEAHQANYCLTREECGSGNDVQIRKSLSEAFNSLISFSWTCSEQALHRLKR